MDADLLLEYLGRFNRKERFLLVDWAFGSPRLSEQLKSKIDDKFDLELPPNPFVALDYHLDWIYASLFLANGGDVGGVHANPERLIGLDGERRRMIGATQEDVDLLIAFKSGSARCDMIIIEVKGVTGWTNAQMQSKAEKLGVYFGRDGNKWPGVIAHFAIASPRNEPTNLRTTTWPTWMKSNGVVRFIQMPPLRRDLLRPTRWDREQGKASAGAIVGRRSGDRAPVLCYVVVTDLDPILTPARRAGAQQAEVFALRNVGAKHASPLRGGLVGGLHGWRW